MQFHVPSISLYRLQNSQEVEERCTPGGAIEGSTSATHSTFTFRPNAHDDKI